ncbi:MAG: hypothetical protein IH969_04595, partial [Candidatus Krumholzibacteriota bacterium]|nr:hypothetical protein [Candidatus Krumholzibacteriota bacterium]
MDQKLQHSAREFILGHKEDWVKRFKVEDYLGNGPLIEKLHEEKQLLLSDALELQQLLKSAEQRIAALNLAKENSKFSFYLSLLSIVFMGLGANLATDSPESLGGWMLVGGGIFGEIIAYLASWKASD